MIAVNDIKPEFSGEDDFFSWQLYRWVRKNPDRTCIFVGWNQIKGSVGNSYPDDFLYIGARIEGWVTGARLRSICANNAKHQSWAYPNSHEWLDVTDQFWADYLENGVCAIWGKLAWHNWQYADGARECTYCKRREVMEIEMVPTERWKAV